MRSPICLVHRMRIHWTSLLKQPHTYLVLLGTALGYGVLIAVSGSRPLVWLGGGTVATAMVGSWISGYRASSPDPHEADNLLNATAFAQRLQAIQPPDTSNPDLWGRVQTWALQSQRFAEHICERDSWLRPELLDTLYTVIDLAQQVADGLHLQAQIQTPAYQHMLQEQLQQRCDRLHQTHNQLQQLHDQVALASLDHPADTTLPQRLQTLIDTNKQLLDVSNHQPS